MAATLFYLVSVLCAFLLGRHYGTRRQQPVGWLTHTNTSILPATRVWEKIAAAAKKADEEAAEKAQSEVEP